MDLKLLYVVAVFALNSIVNVGSLQTYTFKQLCSLGKREATLRIGTTFSGTNSSFILRAGPEAAYKYYDSKYCRVLIIPPPLHFTVVSVKTIDLRWGCADNLTLSDSAGKQHTYCGYYSNNAETESKNYTGNLTVTFNAAFSTYEGYLGYEGFIITVTAYKNTPCLSLSWREFQCSNNRCISNILKCDGRNHCGDRSEQSGCYTTRLPGTLTTRSITRDCLFFIEFQCDNGKCINSFEVCNGYNDCGDWSDERNCGTTTTRSTTRQCLFFIEFRCDNGKCIDRFAVCNGRNDCGDWSDERNCDSTTLTSTTTRPFRQICFLFEFKCTNGKCIDSYKVCNGFDDCGDWSDERNCRTTTTPRSSIDTYSRRTGTSVSKIVGSVFGVFFFFLAIIACGVYYRSKNQRIITRTVFNQQPRPFSVTTHPPPPPARPTFPSSPPMAEAQHYGNPYPPLGKENFDNPPPYSEVVR